MRRQPPQAPRRRARLGPAAARLFLLDDDRVAGSRAGDLFFEVIGFFFFGWFVKGWDWILERWFCIIVLREEFSCASRAIL